MYVSILGVAVSLGSLKRPAKSASFSLFSSQHYYSHLMVGFAFLVFSLHIARLDVSFSKT